MVAIYVPLAISTIAFSNGYLVLLTKKKYNNKERKY